MKFDLEKDGLETVFKKWEVMVLEYIWGKERVTSREVYKAVIEKENISRASIINFLNRMVGEGFLRKDWTTGKGGMRGVYTSLYSKEEFSQELRRRIIEKVEEVFGRGS